MLTILLATSAVLPQQEGQHHNPSAKPIPAGSKIYIAPISGGMENFIAAGIVNKKLPLVLVKDRSMADYEITGVAESQPASWTKHSRERAIIQVTNLKTGEIVLTYKVASIGVDFTVSSSKQQVGEGCAKLLKKSTSAQ
jgi:hypothetical protein